MKKIKIVCGKENVSDFNRKLKNVAPEFYDFIKQLHKAGLIDGLRGATLEIEPSAIEPIVELKKIPIAAKYEENA